MVQKIKFQGTVCSLVECNKEKFQPFSPREWNKQFGKLRQQ